MKLIIAFMILVNLGAKFNRSIVIKAKIINEKGIELKNGSIYEYTNNKVFPYSEKFKGYLMSIPSADTLSFYITHIGYESIKSRVFFKNCTGSDTAFIEFRMIPRKRKVKF